MASVYGEYIYFDSGSGWWRTRVDYDSSNNADVYIEVDSRHTVWVRLTGKLDNVDNSNLNYSSDATVTAKITSIYLGDVNSSHTVSLSCTGGTWGQDGTSTATIPAQVNTLTLNVYPKINNVVYQSGLSGFTFNISGEITANNLSTYSNNAAPIGTYVVTPNSVPGYSTQGYEGSGGPGSTLTLYPTWIPLSSNITLNSEGASSHGTTSVTGVYNQVLPSITPPSRSGANFLGYYEQPNGQGTKYYNADGTTSYTWLATTAAPVTFYAHWLFHDFVKVSQNGGSYSLGRVYVSQNEGSYSLVDASQVKISQNGGNYTNIV